MSPFEMTPHFDPPPPSGPSTQKFLFSLSNNLILEWQQKNSAKTLHTTTTYNLLFLANPKQKTEEKFLSNLKW